MKITPLIREALSEAISDAGSQAELERRAGIRPTTLSKYFTGRIHAIEHENWLLLEPLLKPYIEKASQIVKQNSPIINVSSSTEAPIINVQLNASQLKMLQIFNTMPEGVQDEIIALIPRFAAMSKEKRDQITICAIQNKTCFDIKSEIKSEVKKEVAAVAKDCPPAGHGCPEEKAS